MPEIFPIEEILKIQDANGLLSPEEVARLEVIHAPPTGPFDKTNPKEFAWEIIKYSDYTEKAKEALKGQIVVDIGSGKNISMYRICCLARATAYIAVDHAHIPALRENILSSEYWRKDDEWYIKTEWPKEIWQVEEEIPVVLVPEDALIFLKRLPAHSVSITASGMDRCIIADDYAPNIETEIARALHPQGVYMGYRSRFFLDSLPESLTCEKLDNYFDLCRSKSFERE